MLKESSLCIRILFTENKSVKDCMLRLSSQRTAPEGLILNFCVQTSPNFCTLSSICFSHENRLLFQVYFVNLWKFLETKGWGVCNVYQKRQTWQICWWHIFLNNLIWKESMNNWLWIKWKEAKGVKSSGAPFLGWERICNLQRDW